MAKARVVTGNCTARIAPDALAVVRRAAEILGRSIGDFAIAARTDFREQASQDTIAASRRVAWR
jgi:uncharacterized protein (DUF1778 family)